MNVFHRPRSCVKLIISRKKFRECMTQEEGLLAAKRDLAKVLEQKQ